MSNEVNASSKETEKLTDCTREISDYVKMN